MILSAKNTDELSYIVPDVNISIDNPVAVVDKNVDKHGTRTITTKLDHIEQARVYPVLVV
ncbi:hypothetical protein ANSO36C_48570 [Nostoc cf. commune SO-36]|uniref:Uncharacterized protein n=1 Tax=Nostoc cf. commune SO-36 TaxID=449208 RepID=A0ABM7Z7D1_NOSCO|nr:hypothetical protein ANSO36C_48570 [Nostoc cf. commune SO-36]